MSELSTRAKRLASMTLVSLFTILGGMAMAAPAQAAPVISVNVYVTQNQCPRGGTVGRVNVSITDPGLAGSVGSTSGNQVNGLKTLSGYRSLFQGSNFCKTTWYGDGYYWYWSTSVYARNNGQTVYI